MADEKKGVTAGVPVAPTMSREDTKAPEVYTELSCIENCLVCCVKGICAPCFCNYVQVVRDYERAVTLRFGKLATKEAGRGGLYIVWPGVDQLLRVDIRERTVNVPKQDVVTREGLTVGVDGVVFYKVIDPMKAVFGVNNYQLAVSTLAQTKLRETISSKRFEEVQSDRAGIEAQLRQLIQGPTDPWGIHVMRVEITDVVLPPNVRRAMGQEAESQRNAKAKVIEATGEEKAAQTLKEAATIMSSNPNAMQLRFLQTLTEVATENASTLIIPFPTKFLEQASTGRSGRGGPVSGLLTN